MHVEKVARTGSGPGIAASRGVRVWSGTGRRLFFAFTSLFVILGLASGLLIAGLKEMHDLLHGVEEQEIGIRRALELASAVRDQYAHQAHTIILENETHLGFYNTSHERVEELSLAVRDSSSSTEEKAKAEEIEAMSRELDAIFKQQIVPAVLTKQKERVVREHGRAQGLVTAIQDRTDEIIRIHDKSIGDFQAHAALVEHATLLWSAVSFISATLFAAFVGIYIGRSIARPLTKLEEGASRLAKGDLDTQIAVDSGDEFGRLAQHFNQMTTALKAHQRKLVESEKLAGIGRLAAGVAHEINNPLAVILGYVRLLERNAAGSLATDLRVIEDEAVRCQEIVEGLLDLARPSRIDVGSVSLRELCEEVIARLRETGKLEGVAVSITGDADVEGSSAKLRQVLTNLLKNAAEASGTGGKIGVEIQSGDEGRITVRVIDSGPGVSIENRARIFEPFFTTKAEGTGLGLAISKAIARAHGGDIEVGEGEKGGAIFTVTLPKIAEGVQ
jgi:signal transduction histidine kinase